MTFVKTNFALFAKHFFNRRYVRRIDVLGLAQIPLAFLRHLRQNMAAKRRASFDLVFARFKTLDGTAHAFHLWHGRPFFKVNGKYIIKFL